MRTGRPRSVEFYRGVQGYLAVRVNGRTRPMHVVIAEKALGKPLPHGAVVHHVNDQRDDNRNANLVICQDDKYHRLLHVRARALREGGNVHTRRCLFCGRHDDTANLSYRRVPLTTYIAHRYYHRQCKANYELRRVGTKRTTTYKARPSRW